VYALGGDRNYGARLTRGTHGTRCCIAHYYEKKDKIGTVRLVGGSPRISLTLEELIGLIEQFRPILKEAKDVFRANVHRL